MKASTPTPRVRRVRERAVQVTLAVHANVVEGTVDPEEFTLWIIDALERHHAFRAGFIGTDMCGIQKPIVSLVPPA